ncbi:MAG: M20/M25/M40 family metallo-hydrolase [Candidatus Brocadiae bacterium]|nr:M20/M25/M40 family metallo-hydrolase [Candidatus Brocadiia bacterium]
MTTLRTAFLAAFACAAACADPLDDALATIRPGDVRAHVEFLASDELEGRATLQRGNEIAARYIAGQMRRIGLSPAGPDGSWFQDVPLWISSYRYTWFLELVHTRGGRRDAYQAFLDFTVAPGSGRETAEGPVLFAGYGITAPEYDWDDYAGIDARGKVVVVFRHEPQENDPASRWEGRAMTRHAEFANKVGNAKAHGAVAVVFVNDPLGGHGPLFTPTDVVPDTMTHRTEIGFEEGKDPRNATEGTPAVFVSPEAACAILGRTVEDLREMQRALDAGTPGSYETGGKLLVRTQVVGRLQTTEKKISRNVAGILPGSHPSRMGEVVVVGAHFDHLGVSGSGDDTIFNGADDNASGTAGLLEIAEALASLPEKPDRTVLFIAFTGEEIGLLGSRWYVNSPLFPLDSTVAMINLDMIGRDAGGNPANAKSVTVAGAGTSGAWGPLLGALRSATDLTLLPTNQDPGGSDHFPFRDHRIPVLFFFTGFHPDYHQVSDHAGKIRYDKAAAVARVAARAVHEIAGLRERPAFQDPADTRPEHPEGAERVWLGKDIVLRVLSDEEADKAGLPPDARGLRVWHSRRPTLLQDGDVVVEADGRDTPDVEAFLQALAGRKGRSVTLFVLRGPKTSLFVHLTGEDLEGWARDR